MEFTDAARWLETRCVSARVGRPWPEVKHGVPGSCSTAPKTACVNSHSVRLQLNEHGILQRRAPESQESQRHWREFESRRPSERLAKPPRTGNDRAMS